MLAQTRLGGAEVYGVLLSASGAGSLLGMIAAGSLLRIRRRGRIFIVATAIMGLSLGSLGLVSDLLPAIGLMLGTGIGAGYLGVVLMAWLQARTEPTLHGRVTSLMMFAAVAVDPLSYAVTGALTELDLTITFATAGVLLIATAVIAAASESVRDFR